ncbi:MAG: bacterial Ig-like domain-containing protein, partial [Bacteroidales bacterium]|nr:bacterial Ig-like domain-containing protein [Bacteroidales bacterium]
LNLTGGFLTLIYSNSETSNVDLTDEDVTISGYDKNKTGEQVITVEYLTSTFRFNVRVETKSAIALEIIQLPVIIHYYEGDAFMPDGGEFVVTYNNKTSEILDLGKAKITGFDSYKLGEQKLIVDFMGQKAEIKITVAARPNPNPYQAPAIKDDVCQITTAQDLAWFAIEVNRGFSELNATLVNNIVVNDDLWKKIKKTTKAETQLDEWTPIGSSDYEYCGIFDGQGHSISGIYFNDETQSNVGLFGVTNDHAIIKNLGITDSYFAGDENVGAICGHNDGVVVNCYSISEIKGNKNVNPLVGEKNETSEVKNCYYYSENAAANDPSAKTADDFKSGKVAKLLAQGAIIDGVSYSGDTFEGITELPGTDVINPLTAVAETANSNIRIWSFGSTIYVENADADIYIVNLSGSLITKRTPVNNRMEINLSDKGVYIVKIGSTVQKVVIQ